MIVYKRGAVSARNDPTWRPTVSVITPYYNTGDYIEECIRSVLAQSFSDFEYLLVNNCSDDHSPSVARRYAAADSRIRLINNETFLEQLQNYNGAMRQISPHSIFCKIVQADDWIYEDCLSEMVKLGNSDVRVGLISSYRLSGSKLDGGGLPPKRQNFSGREICRIQLLDGLFFFGSPTTVMYRSELVRSRQPFYSEGRLHADTEACYEILRDWRFGFVHQILSYTRRDNYGALMKARKLNSFLINRLTIAKTYGSGVLSESEYERCWSQLEARYLRFLGHSLLRMRDSAFWNYHKSEWATFGYHPRWHRVLWYAVLEIIDLSLNPKRTTENIIRYFKKRNS